MTNYQIHGPARMCAATGRELRPGEKVFSVLRDEAGQFVRTDYAADAWPGPPPESVAWWAGRIPEAGRPAKPTINDELLVDCFEHLADTTDPARLKFPLRGGPAAHAAQAVQVRGREKARRRGDAGGSRCASPAAGTRSPTRS